MAIGNTPQSAQNLTEKLSPVATQLLAEANTALSRNQVFAAERSLTKLLDLEPSCGEACRLMGIASLMRGNQSKAVDYLRRATDIQPTNSTTHMNLGSALFEGGDTDAGLSHLRRACDLASESAAAWYNLGRALQIARLVEQACDVLQRALSVDPTHIKARIILADVLTSLGDTTGAVANYRDVLDRQPGHAKAWFSLANLKTEKFSDADILELQRLFRRPGATADARIWIGFALAKGFEDKGDYDAAFEILREANDLRHRYMDWSAGEERARVDAIKHAFSMTISTPLDPTLGKEVIFIISLPRSGSTLTEQILASHPQVEGANEIKDLPQVIDDESKRRGQPFHEWASLATAEDWSRLGRDYLARTERWRRHKPRFTDKNLDNWALVGAILAMLPGSRIVNSRRNPLETCFACYRQLFSTGAHFSYDLGDMVGYYTGYDRLSRFWKQQFPQRYFDHVYESLQSDAEGQIRRLLDFCDLEFDPACINFHQTSRAVISTASAAQVRQPLRMDTARSPRYGDKLDPLRKRLRDAGCADC